MLLTVTCVLIIGALFCWGAERHRRREAATREWAAHRATVRSWGARTCPHDSGVPVDETAWAEIVQRLKKTPSG